MKRIRFIHIEIEHEQSHSFAYCSIENNKIEEKKEPFHPLTFYAVHIFLDE